MLGEIGYRGHIVSFEPIADNVEALRRASSSNPRWTVHHLALGNTDDVAEIHVARHSNFSSLMKTSAYGLEQFAGMSDPIRVERVRLARLDTILDSAVSHIDQPRIFLKTDTQGNDMEVFRGAAGCLDRIEGLQAELYFREVYEGAPLFDAALAELQAAGFELTDLYPVGRAAHLEIIDADCLMVRTGAAVDSISGL
jgi:FkbM family methyltransferase